MDTRRVDHRSLTIAIAIASLATVIGCGTSTPSPTRPGTGTTEPPAASSAPASAPASEAEATPPCTLAMLSFGVAPWLGAMGTAYSGIVVGLTSGPPACTLRGAVEVGLAGASAPVIAVDTPAMP